MTSVATWSQHVDPTIQAYFAPYCLNKLAFEEEMATILKETAAYCTTRIQLDTSSFNVHMQRVTGMPKSPQKVLDLARAVGLSNTRPNLLTPVQPIASLSLWYVALLSDHVNVHPVH